MIMMFILGRWRTTTRATRGSAQATSTAAMDMFALTPRTQVVVVVMVVVVVGWMMVVMWLWW